MALTMDEVARIANDAARDASSSLHVAGVTFGGTPDGSYVEILVNVVGCRTGAGRISIGAFRNVEPPRLHQQIADKLRRHLADDTTLQG